MRTEFLALSLWPLAALGQFSSPIQITLTPPFDGSRNTILVFEYSSSECLRFSSLPKDVAVSRTPSGFEFGLNVRVAQPNCSQNKVVTRTASLALPFLLPDAPLPSPMTLSIRLGDGQRADFAARATPGNRLRSTPVPTKFTWNVSNGEQLILGSVSQAQSSYQILPDFNRNVKDFCLRNPNEECFEIRVCRQHGDIGLGTSQFGNNSPSCGAGSKQHVLFAESPSVLTIWNEDGSTIIAFEPQLIFGKWQIVDRAVQLKYGSTGIAIDDNSYSRNNFSEGYSFNGSAGRGAIVCNYRSCRLNLRAPARGNQGIELDFPMVGITHDRIYRFTPFPDVPAIDLARGNYSGLGTWTLVMVRE